jgi:hypothetical protein
VPPLVHGGLLDDWLCYGVLERLWSHLFETPGLCLESAVLLFLFELALLPLLPLLLVALTLLAINSLGRRDAPRFSLLLRGMCGGVGRIRKTVAGRG